MGIGSSEDNVTCALCGAIIPLSHATIGLQYASGEQAFACLSHTYNKPQWIAAWARFEIAQVSHQGYVKPTKIQLCEHRDVQVIGARAMDIAYHLYLRQQCGPTLVITEQPAIFLSIMRKYWLRLCRTVQRERSSTLDRDLIRLFDEKLKGMNSRQFVTRQIGEGSLADVYVVEAIDEWSLKEAASVYICMQLSNDTLRKIRDVMQKDALVVEYT